MGKKKIIKYNSGMTYNSAWVTDLLLLVVCKIPDFFFPSDKSFFFSFFNFNLNPTPHLSSSIFLNFLLTPET
jgi:hypothetical protein